jgi:hypothetical protein
VSRAFWQPRALAIEADAGGQPAWLRWHGRRERVRVCNAWRVEDAWWKRAAHDAPLAGPPQLGAPPPSARAYYTILTASRAALVVFRDEADGRWYLEGVVD